MALTLTSDKLQILCCINLINVFYILCMQVLIEPDDVAVEYWSKAVNSRKPINPGMVFDRSHENIYLASHTKV